jgi:tetratricopeptide (TPR) repeat protein
VFSLFAAASTSVSMQQQARTPEATSLLGRPLYAPEQSAEARHKAEAELAHAEATYKRMPDDPDAVIWLGRRMAYLARYRDAIGAFSKGIEKHPQDARMYRHRGHRYITVRELDRAVADLSKAAQLVAGKSDRIEPDGQPNARNIPTSTLNSNIYYHLGLAHYLRGEFDTALRAYRQCMEYSKNPDMQAATSHWLYMTLRRLQREDEARQVLQPVSPEMEIIENASYHKLLLMYKGVEKPEALLASSGGGGLDAVTIGYGVGNWYLYGGRPDEAMQVFRRIVDEHQAQWAAFGYIAAEAELSPARARVLLR